MESYVVRIYRRDGKKSRVLIGTVELAGTEKKMVFSNIEELGEILRRRKCREEPKKPKPSGPKKNVFNSAISENPVKGRLTAGQVTPKGFLRT